MFRIELYVNKIVYTKYGLLLTTKLLKKSSPALWGRCDYITHFSPAVYVIAIRLLLRPTLRLNKPVHSAVVSEVAQQ